MNCSGQRRRLEQVSEISGIGSLEEIAVRWPYGGYFRPESIACGYDAEGGLMISSAFASYAVHQQPRLHLEEVAAGIEGGVPLCPSPAADSSMSECFWGALSAEGLKLVSASSDDPSVVLPIQGPQWQAFNGAI
eukprot:4094716-Amphidinium_carterae.1